MVFPGHGACKQMTAKFKHNRWGMSSGPVLPVYDHLNRLPADGEDVNDYSTIWNCF